MYIDENIKKLVEDAIKNMDSNGEFFKNIVSQITEQIKNEQEKTEKKTYIIDTFDNIENKYSKVEIPKDTKTVIHDLNKIASKYLTNNKSLDDYISNRDKFMGVFEKITKDKIEKEIDQYEKAFDNIEKIYKETITSDDDCSKENISYTSYTSGWKQTTNKNGNPIGYLYFNFNSNGNFGNDVSSNSDSPDTYKQILDYYSILTLHADEWKNWTHFHKDRKINNFPLSLLVDEYIYQFEDYERGLIDSGGDNVTSFIYTKLDDELKMFYIYILNYSGVTNKLYDYIRLIITPPEDATEFDFKNYYFNLEQFFENKDIIEDFIGEDYCYTYIDRFKVNHHLPVNKEEDMYVLLQGDIIHQIIEKINSESKKVESIDDKFILNRIDVDKSFDLLKNFFDCNKDDKEGYSIGHPIINTGNKYYDDFLSKAINDGYIEVEFLSPESVHLNINGTLVFMNNPYGEF